MQLPSLLLPLISVGPSGRRTGLTLGPAGGAGFQQQQRLPNYVRQQQLQGEWCWAAVSASISSYFAVKAWTQCDIATAEFAASGFNCCGSDGPSGCNQSWHLESALARVGHYDRIVSHAESFAVIQSEIGAGRPLGCHIAWNGGGGHFVVIGGWSIAPDGTEWVDVYDPFFGFTQKTYSSFCAAYHAHGDIWGWTYFTRSGGGGPIGGGMAVSRNTPKNA